MDQASYHRVEEATKFLSESGISIYFLPSGSSELNPIEKCRYYKDMFYSVTFSTM